MARTVTPRAVSEQTRERILAVSEKLFSAHGYDGVSLRQIGTAAEVPFALVTYHYKTKQGLYRAVFDRRIGGFHEDRTALLKRVVVEEGSYDTFRAIAAAFVGPMVTLRKLTNGAQFTQLLAREIFDPSEASRGVIAEYLDPLAKMTLTLLQGAAPHASRIEVARAYQFAAGALAVNHASGERLKRVSGLDEKSLDEEDPTDQLIDFIAAGLQAALAPRTVRRPARDRRKAGAGTVARVKAAAGR